MTHTPWHGPEVELEDDPYLGAGGAGGGMFGAGAGFQAPGVLEDIGNLATQGQAASTSHLSGDRGTLFDPQPVMSTAASAASAGGAKFAEPEPGYPPYLEGLANVANFQILGPDQARPTDPVIPAEPATDIGTDDPRIPDITWEDISRLDTSAGGALARAVEVEIERAIGVTGNAFNQLYGTREKKQYILNALHKIKSQSGISNNHSIPDLDRMIAEVKGNLTASSTTGNIHGGPTGIEGEETGYLFGSGSGAPGAGSGAPGAGPTGPSYDIPPGFGVAPHSPGAVDPGYLGAGGAIQQPRGIGVESDTVTPGTVTPGTVTPGATKQESLSATSGTSSMSDDDFGKAWDLIQDGKSLPSSAIVMYKTVDPATGIDEYVLDPRSVALIEASQRQQDVDLAEDRYKLDKRQVAFNQENTLQQQKLSRGDIEFQQMLDRAALTGDLVDPDDPDNPLKTLARVSQDFMQEMERSQNFLREAQLTGTYRPVDKDGNPMGPLEGVETLEQKALNLKENIERAAQLGLFDTGKEDEDGNPIMDETLAAQALAFQKLVDDSLVAFNNARATAAEASAEVELGRFGLEQEKQTAELTGAIPQFDRVWSPSEGRYISKETGSVQTVAEQERLASGARQQAMIDEQTKARQAQDAIQMFTSILQNPFNFGALQALQGAQPTLQTGAVQPMPQQMPGAGLPLGLQLGGPQGIGFAGGQPTLGQIAQTPQNTLELLAPILGYLGINPATFGRRAAGVTPAVDGLPTPTMLGGPMRMQR